MTEPADRWDDRLREAYRLPLPGEPEVLQRALARLRGSEVTRRAPRRGGWWLDPEALRLSPLGGLAALLVALAIGVWGGARWVGAVRERAAATASDSRHGASSAPDAVPAGQTSVMFAFRAPGATRVSLVGDFNGWDPDATPLRRAATGEVWTVALPLPRGLHAYAFIVDGADWSVDPSAPLAPETTFGRRNALLVVDERGAL